MYTLYKTTNLINGKYYIGVTAGKDKWYKGSGTALKCAIKKYGSKQFKTETLEEFDHADAAFRREAEVVNEQFVADRNTYNMKPGGIGGKGRILTPKHKQRISATVKTKHANGDYTHCKSTGRKTAMNIKILLASVKEHGLVEAAKIFGVSYSTFRARYYRAKK